MCQGDFLAGFQVQNSENFESWQVEQNRWISEMVSSVCHDAIRSAIDLGDFEYGISLANRLIQFNAFDEETYFQFIYLYLLKDQRTQALNHYKAYESLMLQEFGLEPADKIRNLIMHISAEKHLSPSISNEIPDNFPAFQTSFVGRKKELFQITSQLRNPNCRVMTLVGPGGCGKTRLAIEVGKLVSDAFPEGVFFVPFDEGQGLELIYSEIGKAVNFKFDTFATCFDPKTQLIDFLLRKTLLLIIDGFEEFISRAVDILPILEKVIGIKILVTSRQILNLQGEWHYSVSGLPTINHDGQDEFRGNDGINLFVDRAMQQCNHFHPTRLEIQEIARIVQYLEGLPLAIELAAAWIGKLPVHQIASELEKNIDFLERDLQDVQLKHRSLRAIFESSWSLLSSDQKQALSGLSIFEGWFDGKAALKIAQVDLSRLCELADRSLRRVNNEGRFQLTRTLGNFVLKGCSIVP